MKTKVNQQFKDSEYRNKEYIEDYNGLTMFD